MGWMGLNIILDEGRLVDWWPWKQSSKRLGKLGRIEAQGLFRGMGNG